MLQKGYFWDIVSLLSYQTKWKRTPLSQNSSFNHHFSTWHYAEFWGNQKAMALPEQKKRLLKAKIAVALHDELGRVPKTEEIDQVFLLARVMYKAILGLHFQRQEQKKQGQLAIF